jgi:SAM-dependent methyltransferase
MPLTASEIAHEGLEIVNPLPAAKLDRLLDALALSPGQRALDIGCGKGELLLRMHRRHGVGGLGVDLSEPYIEAARAQAPPELEFRVQAGLEVTDTGFDVAACVGSSHALDDHPRRRLYEKLVPGGYVLFGDGYWIQDPHPDYLEALGGASPDDLLTFEELVTSGEDHGLTPVHVVTASQDDWDAYSWHLIAACERDGSPECREYAARERRRLLAPGGRDTLGFALVAWRYDG